MGYRVLPVPEKMPGHLSVSSVQQFERCPYAWQQKYMKKRKGPPMPSHVIFGGVFAKSTEALHLGRDAEVVFARLHAEESERMRARGETLAPDAEYGLQLLRLYMDRPPLVGTPEKSFSLKLPPEFRVPVPIVGFMDIMTAGGVGEFKTSRARWSQARVDNEYQAAVYAWAFKQLTKRDPGEVRYLVFNTMWPAMNEFVTLPGYDKLERFGKAAGDAWRRASARDFGTRCGTCEFCKADFPAQEAA